MTSDLVTIIHGSDLHSDHAFLDALVEKGNELGADVFIHSGDFVDSKSLSLWFQIQIDKFRQESMRNVPQGVWDRHDLLEQLKKFGTPAKLQAAMNSSDSDPELVSRLMSAFEEIAADPMGFQQRFQEEDLPFIQENSRQLQKFNIAISKRLEDELFRDYRAVDDILGRFNGDVYGVLGNHDTIHSSVMRNVSLVNGFADIRGLKVLFAPETQEQIPIFSDEWSHQCNVPYKEEMDQYVRVKMEEDGLSEEEAQRKFFKTFPQLAHIDLDTQPDVVYFHKPYGNLGGIISRLRERQRLNTETRLGRELTPKEIQSLPPQPSAFAHYVMKKFGPQLIYMAGGHFHSGWLGKEDGVVKTVASPGLAFIKKIDVRNKKIVELTPLFWEDKGGRPFSEPDYQEFLESA